MIKEQKIIVDLYQDIYEEKRYNISDKGIYHIYKLDISSKLSDNQIVLIQNAIKKILSESEL